MNEIVHAPSTVKQAKLLLNRFWRVNHINYPDHAFDHVFFVSNAIEAANGLPVIQGVFRHASGSVGHRTWYRFDAAGQQAWIWIFEAMTEEEAFND